MVTLISQRNDFAESAGHEPVGAEDMNNPESETGLGSRSGLKSRSDFRSLISLCKSEYHPNIHLSLKRGAHCQRSAYWQCFSAWWCTCEGTNADTVGVCLCSCCRHHFSEWVTQSQWFGPFEWNNMTTHGIARLQFQMSTMAKLYKTQKEQ